MDHPSWIAEPEGGRTIEANWLFRLRVERYRSRATGRGHDFYVVDLADAVNVVATTPEGLLILVRQFRAGAGRDCLETPGGLVEPGEDPLVAGPRELLEETGYSGDPPRSLGSVYANPSLLTSRMTTVVIANARKVGPTAFDVGEEVEVHLRPAAKARELIRSGQVDHALAVLGLLLWLDAGTDPS